MYVSFLTPSNTELNPICHLLTLLGAHHILNVSRMRVKLTVYRVSQEEWTKLRESVPYVKI